MYQDLRVFLVAPQAPPNPPQNPKLEKTRHAVRISIPMADFQSKRYWCVLVANLINSSCWLGVGRFRGGGGDPPIKLLPSAIVSLRWERARAGQDRAIGFGVTPTFRRCCCRADCWAACFTRRACACSSDVGRAVTFARTWGRQRCRY